MGLYMEFELSHGLPLFMKPLEVYEVFSIEIRWTYE